MHLTHYINCEQKTRRKEKANAKDNNGNNMILLVMPDMPYQLQVGGCPTSYEDDSNLTITIRIACISTKSLYFICITRGTIEL